MLAKGRRKVQILMAIYKTRPDNPMDSGAISKSLKMEKSNVIRILNELEAKGVVKCVTGNRKRDRVFVITKKGRDYLEAYLNLIKKRHSI